MCGLSTILTKNPASDKKKLRHTISGAQAIWPKQMTALGWGIPSVL